MPIGAAIHGFGFLVMSLPVTYFTAAFVFAPIVTSRYLHPAISIMPLGFLGLGLGFGFGDLGAKSMCASAGPDYDAIVHAFTVAGVVFAVAFFLMSQFEYWSSCWRVLGYTGNLAFRFARSVIMAFTRSTA